MAAALRAEASATLEGHDEMVRAALLDSGTPLEAPVATVKEKWRLLPAFLKVRGLVKQHLVSYDHLVNVEMQEIVQANNEIRVSNHPNFYIRFNNCRLDEPSIDESIDAERTWVNGNFSPQECRLRDITYSSPIKVDLEYTQEAAKGWTKRVKRDVCIGRMPMMLKSSKCILYNRDDKKLSRMGECPCDPGGYFIVKGSEKVILVQEQVCTHARVHARVCARVRGRRMHMRCVCVRASSYRSRCVASCIPAHYVHAHLTLPAHYVHARARAMALRASHPLSSGLASRGDTGQTIVFLTLALTLTLTLARTLTLILTPTLTLATVCAAL